MVFDKKDIEKIAELSRIKLTEEEKERFSKDLSSILDMVEKLNEVETKEGDTEYPYLKNIFSEDEARPSNLTKEELLKNAPMTENGMIKVRKVLE